MANVVEVVFRATDRGVARVLGNISGGFSGLGGIASTALGVLTGTLMVRAISKIGELGIKAVGMAMDFQDSIIVLDVAARDWGMSAEKLSDIAITLGKDTALVGVTSAQAADAMLALARDGVSAGVALGDLEGYMNGTAEASGILGEAVMIATATELDLVGATRLGIQALNIFGREAEASGKSTDEWLGSALDLLVRTADASAASVTDLGASLRNVGPVLAGLGVPISEASIALGILSNSGISASKAGSGMRAMFSMMIRDTPKVTDMWDALGVSMYDAEGAMRPLGAVFGDLEKAMSTMSEEQRAVTIRTLAGTYGQNTMNALLTAGEAGWNDMAASIANAAGAQEYAEAKTKTLAAKWEILKDLFNTSATEIGLVVIPALTNLAVAIIPIAERVLPVVIGFFEKLVTGSGALGEILGVLAGIFQADVLPVLIAVGAAIMEQLWPALQELFGALDGEGGTIISMFASYWSQWLLPAIKLVAAFIINVVVPVLAEIFRWLAQVLPPAIQMFANFWNNVLMPAMAVVMNFIQQNILPAMAFLKEAFVAAWSTISMAVQTAIDIIVGTVWPILQGAIETLQETMGGAGVDWARIWELMKSVIIVVFAIIGGIIAGAIGIIVGLLQGLAQGIAYAATFWGYLRDAVMLAIEGILNFLGGAFTLIIGLFTGNSEKIKAGWEQLWTGVKQFLEGILNTIGGVFLVAFSFIIGLVQGFIEGVIAFFTGLYNSLVGGSIIPDLVNSITQWFRDLVTWVSEAIAGFVTWMETTWNTFSTWFMSLWDTLNAWFMELIATLVAWLTDTWSTWVDAFTELIEGMKTWFEETWDALSIWFQELITTLLDAVMVLWDTFKTSLETLIDALITWVMETWETFKTNLEALVTNLTDAVTLIWDTFSTTLEGVIDTLLNVLSGLWETFKTTISGIVEGIVASIVDIFQGQDWLGLGADIINGIKDGVVKKAKDLADSVARAAKRALDAAKRALGIGSPSRVTSEEIGTPFVEGIMRGIDTEMPKLQDGLIDGLSDMLDKAGGYSEDGGGKLGEKIVNAILTALSKLQVETGSLLAILKELWDQYWTWFVDRHKGAWDQYMIDGAPYVTALKDGTVELLAWLLLQWDTYWVWFVDRHKAAWDQYMIDGAPYVAALRDGTVELLAWLLEQWDTYWIWFIDTHQTTMDEVFRAADQFAVDYYRLTGQLLQNVTKAWTDFASQLVSITEGLLNAMLSAWQTFAGRLLGIVQTLVAGIIRAFTAPNWVGVGTSIIAGITAGVRRAAGKLAAAAAAAARAAMRAAKFTLGIASPSKVARNQIGIPFVEGIGQGILHGMRGVERDMSQAMSALASQAQRPQLVSQGTNGNGGVTLHIHGDVTLEGVQDPGAFIKELQKLMR